MINLANRLYLNSQFRMNDILIDFEHRLELCRLNFEDLSSEKTEVVVKDLEKQVRLPFQVFLLK